jgi:hypothetical protein
MCIGSFIKTNFFYILYTRYSNLHQYPSSTMHSILSLDASYQFPLRQLLDHGTPHYIQPMDVELSRRPATAVHLHHLVITVTK